MHCHSLCCSSVRRPVLRLATEGYCRAVGDPATRAPIPLPLNSAGCTEQPLAIPGCSAAATSDPTRCTGPPNGLALDRRVARNSLGSNVAAAGVQHVQDLVRQTLATVQGHVGQMGAVLCECLHAFVGDLVAAAEVDHVKAMAVLCNRLDPDVRDLRAGGDAETVARLPMHHP